MRLVLFRRSEAPAGRLETQHDATGAGLALRQGACQEWTIRQEEQLVRQHTCVTFEGLLICPNLLARIEVDRCTSFERIDTVLPVQVTQLRYELGPLRRCTLRRSLGTPSNRSKKEPEEPGSNPNRGSKR